jgi:NADH:ubiquinone oxidoreductase subunit K
MKFSVAISLIFFFSGLVNASLNSSKNLLSFLICIEIAVLGISLLFIIFGLAINLPDGLVYSFLLLLMSVGESAIGLSLCILNIKNTKTIEIEDWTFLKF